MYKVRISTCGYAQGERTICELEISKDYAYNQNSLKNVLNHLPKGRKSRIEIENSARDFPLANALTAPMPPAHT